MITDTVLGLIAAGVPLLLVGALLLRKKLAILAFYVVLLAVGFGYLSTTGAIHDIGAKVRPHIPASLLSHQAATPPAKPAAAKPAAPAPAQAMKPIDPAPAMKPAETPAAAPAEAAPAQPAPAPAPAPTPAPAPANP